MMILFQLLIFPSNRVSLMKTLFSILNIIFILLVHTAWANENNYKPAFIYNYLLEPLLNIDELLQGSNIEVTHCQIMDPNSKQKNVYGGLGSCLYKTLPFKRDKENNSKKQIYIHTLINKREEITLTLSWNPISMMNIFNSYWDETLDPFNNRFILRVVPPHTLSDFLSKVLKIESTDSNALNIDALQIDIAPYNNEENISSIIFSILEEEVAYSMEIITNYYLGSENFFIISKDKYKENEIH